MVGLGAKPPCDPIRDLVGAGFDGFVCHVKHKKAVTEAGLVCGFYFLMDPGCIHIGA